MCCKSWKTFLPFLVTFILGVVAVIPFQVLKTEKKVLEVKNEAKSLKENGGGSAACSAKSHSSEINCFACQNGMIEVERKTPSSASKALQILSKPRATYTDLARTNQTQGTVTLRITFLANGGIGQMGVIKPLPDGLTEQALVAAMNIKFEPAIQNGKPVTVTKQVQYSFTLY